MKLPSTHLDDREVEMLFFMLKYKTDFLFEVLRLCAVKIIPVCSIVFIEMKYELCKSCILIARCRNLTVHFSGSSFFFFFDPLWFFNILLLHWKPAEAMASLCYLRGVGVVRMQNDCCDQTPGLSLY